MTEQETLFEDNKKQSAYRRTHNNNGEFSPTFTDKEFVSRFNEYCRRNNLNRTLTMQKWLSERLDKEEDNYLNSLSKEQLIAMLKSKNC